MPVRCSSVYSVFSKQEANNAAAEIRTPIFLDFGSEVIGLRLIVSFRDTGERGHLHVGDPRSAQVRNPPFTDDEDRLRLRRPLPTSLKAHSSLLVRMYPND